MNFATVCSGIEAVSVACIDLGMTPVFFSEIDKSASAVLSHHYPAVPNLGDFTKIGDDDGAIDLLAAGTPCQDFSVAGLRAGMDGARGQLTVEFAKLAGRKRPRWILWENVPGILSIDGGRAFGTFLGLLGELGYGFAYRVLDAQHFGVPQRRRRVFVVGHLGDWRRAAAVLFERHSLSGHPPPRREKGQGFTHELAPSLTGSGRGIERGGDSRGQDPVVSVYQSLRLRESRAGREGCDCPLLTGVSDSQYDPKSSPGMPSTVGRALVSSTGDISHCLNAGGMGRQDYETETVIVTHSLRADGFDASEDGTGRGTPLVPVMRPEYEVDTHKLGTCLRFANGETCIGCGDEVNGEPLQAKKPADCPDNCGCPDGTCEYHGLISEPIAIQGAATRETETSGPDGVGVRTDGIAYTLEARSEVQAVAFRTAGDGAVYEEGLTTAPLTTATDPSANIVAFTCKDHGADVGETSPTLRAMGHDGSHANAGGQVAVAMNLRGRDGGAMPEMDELASIRAASGGSSRSYLATTMAVRRLTPRECERLQGFPDDYTRIPLRFYKMRRITKTRPANRWDKVDGGWMLMTADGPRYKMLGNSMAVPVIRWIAKRILEVDSLASF